MTRLTPVLVVDRIEPCLDFWVRRLGFEQTVSVPEGDHLGFVALVREGVQVNYRTRTSLRHDIPALPDGDTKNSPQLLHIEVSDFATILDSFEEMDIVVPLRRTFFGGTEIYVRAPGGHLIAFSGVSKDGRTPTDMGL